MEKKLKIETKNAKRIEEMRVELANMAVEVSQEMLKAKDLRTQNAMMSNWKRINNIARTMRDILVTGEV